VGLFSLAVAVLSIIHWTILYFHLPVFTWIVWWFWKFTETPLKALWMAPLLAVFTFFCLRWVFGAGVRKASAVLVLMILGVSLQMGFGFMEGRGIEGIRYRMETSGHSAFARYAVKVDGFSSTIKNYEKTLDKLERDGQDTWGRSKPPGTMLLYLATERLANLADPGASQEQRLWNLRTLASYLWPVISYLVLIPLYLFATRFLDEDTAIISCALYVLVPSVTLMPLHTDQTFFPLFAMCALYLFARAVEKGSAVLGVASGIWFYLIIFTTFSLLFILPLLLIVSLGIDHEKSLASRARTVSIEAAFSLIGFIGCEILFWIAFNYHIVARFRGAMENHVEWKEWAFDFFHVVHSGAMNLVEFAVWIGVPLTLLACYGVYRMFKTFNVKKADPAAMLALGLILVVTALNIFGQTKGETARLWLFLVPFVCVIGARSLLHLKRSEGNLLLVTVFMSQWITILLTKMNQDFY